MEKKSFLDQEPPPGYIAGIGRGATGFVTQADLGPARIPLPIVSLDKTDSEQFKDSPIDHISATAKEDLEAEEVYDEVEKYLERKRGKKRKTTDTRQSTESENSVVAKPESSGKSIQTIAEQFQDVKKDLASISKEEWELLPESGDFTRRNKRLRNELQEQQRFYRNSDMIALSLKDAGSTDLALDEANEQLENKNNNNNDDDDGDNNEDGSNIEDTGLSQDINLLELSKTKDRLLEQQLKLRNQKILSDNVDKNDYLEKLRSSNKFNIGDYQKTRRLFAKLRDTNPLNPQNWIASANLEVQAKQFTRAKKLIQEGCEKIPKSEEIWLTNLEINMEDIQVCKVIVADAIKYNFKSVKLWLKAVDLERDNLSKIRILRKALELLPKEPRLWLEIVKYEENATISIKMLEKATTIISDSLELWVALSELQNVDDSISTLITSIDHIQDSEKYKIWIKIAVLEEERSSNEVKISNYVEKAIDVFHSPNKNDELFSLAETCENEKHILTCRAIILKLLTINSDENVDELITKAKDSCNNGHIEISSSILFFITSNFPGKINAWLELITLKKNLKQYTDLFLTYEMAINSLPHDKTLYIMYATDRLKFDKNIEKVRSILAEGLQQLPNNEDLWLYTINVESKFGTDIIVKDLFENCLDTICDPSSNVWLKRVKFITNLGNYTEALRIVDEAISKFPREEAFYGQKCEILRLNGDLESVKSVLHDAIKQCPSNENSYIQLAKLYENDFSNVIKARSILDEALSKHPQNEHLHHARILLELETNNKTHALRLMSKALTLVPYSPLIWCDNIRLATKQQTKNVYAMALRKTEDNPLVILMIARDFWKTGKIDKANHFFKACLEKDDLFGDVYIYYYAFLLKYGTKEEMRLLESRISLKFEMLHGERWNTLVSRNEKRNVNELQLLREAAVEVSKSV